MFVGTRQGITMKLMSRDAASPSPHCATTGYAVLAGRVVALLLSLMAAGAYAAEPTPSDQYKFCADQPNLAREIDCRCFAVKMATAQAAEPGRAPEVHQGVAAAACPNEAGLREQETRKCLDSPGLYLPRDRDVSPASYCACWGREYARERMAFAPKVPVAVSSGFWSAAAKAHCDAAPHAAALPPAGPDLSGAWQLALVDYEVRVELRPPKTLPTPAADGSRTVMYSGAGARSGGRPLLGTVDITAWTDASGNALDLRQQGLPAGGGCEGKRRADGNYAGNCFDAGGRNYPFIFARTNAPAVPAPSVAQTPPPAPVGTTVVPTADEREPATDSARQALAAARGLDAVSVQARAAYYLRARRDGDAARALLVQCATLFCTYAEIAASAALARVTLARMSDARAVQMNGFGSML